MMKGLTESLQDAQIPEVESDFKDLINEDGTVNEGLLGGFVGAVLGGTIGNTIMKAVCKALGIQSGVLYTLLTSKLVCAAAAAAIGYKGAQNT